LVASIEDGGPAATAGVLVGDTLLELDWVAVADPDELREVLGDRPGKPVKLVVSRAGQRVELQVTLGSKP
jgi:S1-C subfamily serine protease